MHNIIDGVERFQREVYPKYRDRFEELSQSQRPETLLITCADSRIVPDLITQTGPGALFTCRNAGNIVPPYGDSAGGVSATIEYAAAVLRVRSIVVCGHSDCGAMKGAMHPEKLSTLPAVSSWLSHAAAATAIVRHTLPDESEDIRLQALTRENVLLQIQHLTTHPAVAVRLAQQDIQVHGWVYDISSGGIAAYDAKSGSFGPLSRAAAPVMHARWSGWAAHS